MVKKKHITPIIMDDPEKVAFHAQALKMELAATTAPLATDEEVNQAIATVTNKPLPRPVEKFVEKSVEKSSEKAAEKSLAKPKKTKKVENVEKTVVGKAPLPSPTLAKNVDAPRNVKKRETSKGTQAYAVMIDKNVAVEVKMKAFQSGTTFSDVVNSALMQYLLVT